MKKILLFTIILLGFNQYIFSFQSTPKALFEKAYSATQEKDITKMQECLTKTENVSIEEVNALAELIIFSQSGEFEKFAIKNKSKFREIKNPEFPNYLQDLLFLDLIPNIEKAATVGEYNDENDEFKIPNVKTFLKYKLTEQNEKWTFWIDETKSNTQFTYLNNFLKGLIEIFDSETTSSEDLEFKISNLIKKYPK